MVVLLLCAGLWMIATSLKPGDSSDLRLAHLPHRIVDGRTTNDLAVVNGQVVHQNGGTVNPRHWETPKLPSDLPALMLDRELLLADEQATRRTESILNSAITQGAGRHNQIHVRNDPRQPKQNTVKRSTCDDESCHSHGYCVQLPGVPQHRCECHTGWSGNSCGIDMDECVSQPCQNNGKCRDSSSGFIGFRRIKATNGKLAKVGIRVELGKFHCSCKQGFLGDRCDLEVDGEL
jgi:hypothetical protein